ncbi:nucleotidyltransferase domain-containing protein [Lachnospiraceae bacterium OttesenSCG-928-D06]|nr:nucleotidyltransferase domain-containing protein [Lachnospiraceae bacterium OttesenSCG-928-D06]
MKQNDAVVKYVLNKINQEFKDDIDLLVIYGSYINGTENDKSDVDMYVVPKNENGYNLGETFILNGIGYDIFCIPWERLSSIADFKESLSPLIGDVRVAYSHSQNELDRFEKLQKQMKLHLNDPLYMRSKSYDRIVDALEAYKGLPAETSLGRGRLKTGKILLSLAEAVAYANETYFHKGLKTQYTDLCKMKKEPENFTRLYHDSIIADNLDALKDMCYKILNNTLEFFQLRDELNITNENTNPSDAKIFLDENLEYEKINYKDSADSYQEMSSTFNKIYLCAENGDYVLAFISAYCLQRTIESAFEFRILQLQTTDLLSEYQYNNLEKLAVKARNIEKDIINQIESKNIKIRAISSLSEL